MVAPNQNESRPEPQHDHTNGHRCPACDEKRRLMKARLRQWDRQRNRTSTNRLIDLLRAILPPAPLTATRQVIDPAPTNAIHDQMRPQAVCCEHEVGR